MFNTLRLLALRPNSYIFVKMSVKWKDLHIVKYNFGDDLNVYLLEELTGLRVLKYDEFLHFSRKNVLCVGSILEYLCNEHSIIWGSGSLFGLKENITLPTEIRAVRGKYTEALLINKGGQTNRVYGDPALLLPVIYTPCTHKKYKIGVIPHYKDLQCDAVIEFQSKYPDCLIINFHNYRSWKETIDMITSCDAIISSSLHGLIISDAYGIPNVRITLSNDIAGGDFKYKDYYSGIGIEYKEPIDCRKRIDLETINEAIRNYTPIKFDSTNLLRSCPFPIRKDIKERFLK